MYRSQNTASKRSSLEASPDPALIDLLRHPSPETRSLLGDSLAETPFVACHVSDPFGDFSPMRDITVGGFSEYFLVDHCEQLSKAESGTIYADLHGERKNACASVVSALVYDLDGGKTYEAVRDQRQRHRHAGASWTTYTHWQITSQIDASAAIDWRSSREPIDARTPFTDEQVQALCVEFDHGRLAHLRNVRVANGGAWFQADGAYVLGLEHDPVDKIRDLYFIEPIDLTELGIDGFKALYRAIGDELYGVGTYDASCCNPSRIFWNPAHPPGGRWELDLYPGDLYPWRKTWDRLMREVEARRIEKQMHAQQRLAEPPTELAEIAQVLKSIPASLGRKDWFACIGAIFHETRGSEEGRQLAHDWSSGDPFKYDPDDLDQNVWPWFEAQDGATYTMGTLIYLARKYDPRFRARLNALLNEEREGAVWGSYRGRVVS